MLIKIENNKVEVVEEQETPAVCKSASRVVDELHGFLEYRELEAEYAKAHPGSAPRYDVPRLQELGHLFLALNDFLAELVPLLNEEEFKEFKVWKRSLEGE